MRLLAVAMLVTMGCSGGDALESWQPPARAAGPRAGSSATVDDGDSSSAGGGSAIVDAGGSPGAAGSTAINGGGIGGASQYDAPSAGTGGRQLSTAGQPSAGMGGSTGTVVVDQCGNGRCDPYDAQLGCAWECSCGDGVCSALDFDFSTPGPNYLPDLSACRSDCHSCGNGTCDVTDSWLGCSDECAVKQPERVDVCPPPVWNLSYNADFLNPYRPGAPMWMPGDVVRQPAAENCWVCTNPMGCTRETPGSAPDAWKPSSCDC